MLNSVKVQVLSPAPTKEGKKMRILVLWPIILIAAAFVGRFCIDFIVVSLFADPSWWTGVPYFVQAIIGLILSEVAIPGAVVTWLVSFFVSFPLF